MSTVETTAGAAGRTADPDAGPDTVPAGGRGRGTGGRLGLAAMVVVAVAAYVVLAIRASGPAMFPDEFRYTQLAKSLAGGDGFSWRNDDLTQTAALYVYLIAPIWKLFGSTSDAYDVTKAVGAVCLSTTAIPVWVLARRLLDQRLALLCAALSVAGGWMLAAGMTVTEVIAYPAVVAALSLTVMALQRPGGRLGYLALAFALLATWARIQVVVVVPAIFAAFALDALRYPERRREALAAHRSMLLLGGVATVLLGAVAHRTLGDYHVLFGFRPPYPLVERKVGLQLLELVAAGGFVPVLAAFGSAFSARAWRDPRTGPLLLVFWLAAAAFVLQSGWYLAGINIPGGIERYATYPLPLAFVLTAVVATQPGLLPRRSLLACGALLLTLLLLPRAYTILIEPATWSMRYRLHQIGVPEGPAPFLAGTALLGLTLLILARVRRPGAAATAACALVLAVLLVQGEASWNRLITLTRSQRAQLGADAQWVDHHAHGPVSVLTVGATSVLFANLDFFNRDIARVYVPIETTYIGPPLAGGTCGWRVAATGELRVTCPAPDGRPPHELFINDPESRVTFADEVASVENPRIGRLVRVSPLAPPRVRAIVTLPCITQRTPGYPPDKPIIIPADAATACRGGLETRFWLPRPAEMVVHLTGGTEPHTIGGGRRTWTVLPWASLTLRLPVPKGRSRQTLAMDWTSSEGAPTVDAVYLEAGGRRTDLLR